MPALAGGIPGLAGAVDKLEGALEFAREAEARGMPGCLQVSSQTLDMLHID